MAISVITATDLKNTSGGSVTASVTATAGNALIVGGGAAGGSTWTVTRSGDTYTTDITGASGSSRTGIASAPNVAGGTVSMTISSTSASIIEGWAMEVSGLATSSMRDATSPAVKTGTTSPVTSNSLTNVTADAIFVCAYNDDTANGTVSITPGTGWSDVAGSTTMTETNGSSVFACAQEYQIVSTTGAISGSFTVGLAAAWACVIAVYRIGTGGYSPPPVFPGVFNLDARRMI